MATERLRLIPLKESDIDFFQVIHTKSYVRKFLWDNTIMPFDVFKQIVHDVALDFKIDGSLETMLESFGVIGCVGLHAIDYGLSYRTSSSISFAYAFASFRSCECIATNCIPWKM